MSSAISARRGLAGAFGYTAVSQALSAASNFAIAVAVGRYMGPSGLGAFTLAFTVYTAILICSRALISEPMLASRQRLTAEGRAASMTLTVLLAVIGSLVAALIGVLEGNPVLLVTALIIPVTLVQDVLRFQAFTGSRPSLAVVLDGSWLIGTFAAWPVLAATRSPEIATAMWGAAAGCGIVAVARALRPRLTSPRKAFVWWRAESRGLAGPLLADSFCQIVTLQAIVWVVHSTQGVEDLGLYRASQIYFAPIGILFTAFTSFAVPYLARRSTELPGARSAFRMASAISGAAALICLTVALAEPFLRGALYDGRVAVPPAVLTGAAAYIVVSAFANGLSVVSKVRRRGRDIARSRVLSVMVGLPTTIAAIQTAGIAGAAWGAVLQNLAYAILLAIRIRRLRLEDRMALRSQRASTSEPSTVRQVPNQRSCETFLDKAP